jgi:opacity protein-like surface antigen
MQRRLPALVSLAGALLAAAPLTAQSNSDPSARWGAHAGIVTGRDADGARATAGVHWRPRLTGALGLELSAGYERQSWVSAQRRVEADHVPVEGSLLFYFLYTRRIQPYLLAGIGYHWVNPHGAGFSDGSPYASQNLFGLHGGAGVDVRAGESLSVWLDGRWTFLDVDAVKDLGLKSDTIRIAAGVNLAF